MDLASSLLARSTHVFTRVGRGLAVDCPLARLRHLRANSPPQRSGIP